MNGQEKILDLTRSHADFALDFVRMFLGVALFVRGVLFIGDSSRILQLVETAGMDQFLPSILLIVVIIAHLLGGILLSVGLLSQFAALIQIPVLAGAVVISLVQGGPFMPDQSFELSVIVLILLAIIFRLGSGKMSLDHLIFVRGKDEELERQERLRIITLDLKRQVEQADNLRAEELDEIKKKIKEHEASLNNDMSLIAANIAIVGKYVVSVGAASVLLIVGLQALPFEVSAAEVAVTAALLFAIVGFFFFFFSWALRED